MNAFIAGTGFCLPDRVVDNNEIVGRINTSEEFIVQRTGVLTRRHVEPQMGLKDLIIPAVHRALENAELVPADIDMLIVNTLSPDFHDPSEACLIQSLVGLRNVPAFDIRAQCCGLLYGMDIARQFILTGRTKNVLIVCAEILSKRMDVSDEGRNLSILLGDGAGAVILQPSSHKERGVMDILTFADGNHYELLWTRSPGSSNPVYNFSEGGTQYFRMNGKHMFTHAVKSMLDVTKEILLRNNITMDDIDWLIPHQPNLKILEEIITNLNFPKEKVMINVDRLGNMASASLPVTLATLYEREPSLAGKKGLILGYGSGATWGAILYNF